MSQMCMCGHEEKDHPENEEGDKACTVQGCKCTYFAPIDEDDEEFLKSIGIDANAPVTGESLTDEELDKILKGD